MHNSGKVFATRNRYPFKMIYVESLLNKYDAAAREKFLKTGWGKNFLNKIMKNYLSSSKSWEGKQND